MRIGSAKDGVVQSFIPRLGTNPDAYIVGEGVAADGQGNVYWAETSGGMTVRKFSRKQHRRPLAAGAGFPWPRPRRVQSCPEL